MPRCAALLCIRNEANRLGWWIAHHIAAGFTALLVCDDHSTDGSRDILSQAARNYDIRLLETNPEEKNTLLRHEAALTEMLRQEGPHFDWIIQLAVDEYFLPGQGSVSSFMADVQAHMGKETFRQADHIPVNWCITGLGKLAHQRLDGQTPHPRALFTSHAARNFPDHRVTRDFFRPGNEAKLPDPFAHLQSPVDWRWGRILHDAAASSKTPQSRRHYNRNDHPFPEGQALLPETLTISAHILQGLIISACYDAQNRKSNLPEAAPPPVGPVPRFRRFYLRQGKNILVLDRADQSLRNVPEASLQKHNLFTPLCLVQSDDTPDHAAPAWLYAEQPSPLPYLPAMAASLTLFPALLDCLPLRTERHGDAVKLKLAPSGLAFPTAHPDGLTLQEAPLPSGQDSILEALQHFTAHGFSAAGLKEAISRSRWLSPSVIGALYALLPAKDASMLLTPLLHRFFHGWRS